MKLGFDQGLLKRNEAPFDGSKRNKKSQAKRKDEMETTVEIGSKQQENSVKLELSETNCEIESVKGKKIDSRQNVTLTAEKEVEQWDTQQVDYDQQTVWRQKKTLENIDI